MELVLDDHPMETAVDIAAAAVFAAAIAFAVSALLSFTTPAAPILAAPAFLLVFAALRSMPAGHTVYSLPLFELKPLDTGQANKSEGGELLLTPAHMLYPQAGAEYASLEDELLLDDVLAQLEPDPRVVRLFEPKAMPTAGELKASIDRHLCASQSKSVPPDASQALSDALALLRRSLR